MATSDLGPLSADERLIYRVIVLTWLAWAVGALYLIAPVLGWVLAGRLALGWYLAPGAAAPPRAVRIGVGTWIAGSIVMLIVLVVGHVNFDYDWLTIVKSIAGWAKGWALFAIFIAIGAAGTIRPAVVFRASNVLALQTLVMALVLFVCGQLAIPPQLYVSPLEVLGGGGAGFFDVDLYVIDPEGNRLRWKFFAPWAPAAALLACLALVMALYERHPVWRTIGIVAALVVALMTSSRLAAIAIPVILVAAVVLPRLLDPRTVIACAVVGVAAILVGDAVMAVIDDLTQSFTSARASSSRVRAALQTIALHRWWEEAPLFGHGAVERGSHLVEFMPIGSHHNWNGLLFTRGMVGLASFLVPFVVLTAMLVVRSQADRIARAAVVSLVALVLFSFGENLEIVAYLIWPTLIVLGAALRRPSAGSREAAADQRVAGPSPVPA